MKKNNKIRSSWDRHFNGDLPTIAPQPRAENKLQNAHRPLVEFMGIIEPAVNGQYTIRYNIKALPGVLHKQEFENILKEANIPQATILESSTKFEKSNYFL